MRRLLEELFASHYKDVYHYLYSLSRDASLSEDLAQEVFMEVVKSIASFREEANIKTWLFSIARNRCNDYFRHHFHIQQVPLEEIPESKLTYGRLGPSIPTPVEETMDTLTEKDRQILRLYFWQKLSLAEISKKLNIPVGTVKSRLHTAKAHFKDQYPYPPKGEHTMTRLPKIAPKYTIERADTEPFFCKWEELQGWMIVPKLGEKLSWALYEAPSGRRTEWTEMEVIGKAEVHGIQGVEITAIQYGAEDYYRTGCVDKMERRFIAQLTDTHSRYLAESHVEDGMRKVYTFMDGEEFTNNWGFGEDNCGQETNLSPKGLLKRAGNTVTGQTPREIVDIVGRYKVTINGKSYDTVCVMDIQCFNDGVASEQYIDRNGRTVLWRRFNHDRWAMERFGNKTWSEKLPDNGRLTINGEIYVHWYDCISDYVL